MYDARTRHGAQQADHDSIGGFTCDSCGHVHHKWKARCENCEEWSSPRATNKTERSSPSSSRDIRRARDPGGERQIDVTIADSPLQIVAEAQQISEDDENEYAECIRVSDIDRSDVTPRISTGNKILDRVLGGDEHSGWGAMPGSMILLGGDPGCGKSTLMGETARNLSPDPVLYASGEENLRQIADRKARIDALRPSILISHENDIDKITRRAEREKVKVLIVDSLQTLRDNRPDAPRGEQQQLTHCTKKLMDWAKTTGVPVFLICHINKDAKINGPKAVEHFIDVSLMMKPDKKREEIRHLFITIKNRFGDTQAHGSYLMTKHGLQPLPDDEDHGFAREPEGVDDMTPIAQELLHTLVESGVQVPPSIRERIGDRLDFSPRGR